MISHLSKDLERNNLLLFSVSQLLPEREGIKDMDERWMDKAIWQSLCTNYPLITCNEVSLQSLFNISLLYFRYYSYSKGDRFIWYTGVNSLSVIYSGGCQNYKKCYSRCKVKLKINSNKNQRVNRQQVTTCICIFIILSILFVKGLNCDT